MSYLLFGGETYYPSGGWGDFLGEFDTIDEAKQVVDRTRGTVMQGAGYRNPQLIPSCDYDWAHIVHQGKIVTSFFIGVFSVIPDGWETP